MPAVRPPSCMTFPGLRDSVRHESTGLVVPVRPEDLSDAMSQLTNDSGLYSRLAAECKSRSGTFSFDESARLVAQAATRTLEQVGPKAETEFCHKW